MKKIIFNVKKTEERVVLYMQYTCVSTVLEMQHMYLFMRVDANIQYLLPHSALPIY